MERATFTLEQVRDIFRAGVRAGEHGGSSESDFASELHDIANEGIGFDSPEYITYGDAPTMFAQLAARTVT